MAWLLFCQLAGTVIGALSVFFYNQETSREMFSPHLTDEEDLKWFSKGYQRWDNGSDLTKITFYCIVLTF